MGRGCVIMSWYSHYRVRMVNYDKLVIDDLVDWALGRPGKYFDIFGSEQWLYVAVKTWSD